MVGLAEKPGQDLATVKVTVRDGSRAVNLVWTKDFPEKMS
jgi:hypothetical protein